MSVEEYTREFERLLIKYDLKEDEDQTLVRYLGGLDERIAYVVELHPYHTLDELSSLVRKVEIQKRGKGKTDVFDHWKDQEMEGFSLNSHGLRGKHTARVKRGARLKGRKRTVKRLRERMEL